MPPLSIILIIKSMERSETLTLGTFFIGYSTSHIYGNGFLLIDGVLRQFFANIFPVLIIRSILLQYYLINLNI